MMPKIPNCNGMLTTSDETSGVEINLGSVSHDRESDLNESCESVEINTDIDLKILVWNIQGLSDKFNSHNLLGKISEFDIVIFLETMKLDSYCPNTGNFIYKHYQRKYQNARARRPSGGIGVLIKSNLHKNDNTDISVTIEKVTDFVVWLKISQKFQKDSFIGGIYIPPLGSSSTNSNFVNNNAYQQRQMTKGVLLPILLSHANIFKGYF